MTGKSLAAMLASINIDTVRGSESASIRGITYDSRRVKDHWIFCALPGVHVDGQEYIPQAIEKGAAAILHQGNAEPKMIENFGSRALFVQVDDVRRAMSALAAELWEHPSERIRTIGVTGTDGKSSTVFFLHQLLGFAGVQSGFLSTVAMKAGDSIEVNPFRQSTPEAPEIHEILRRMVDSGKEAAALEATSHGLSKRTARLADVHFSAAVLTNITHEHLEFHGTFEQYRDDKANLFRAIDAVPDGFGVVNSGDPNATYFSSVTSKPVYRYTITPSDADATGRNLRQDSDGISFDVDINGRTFRDIRLNTPGGFNVENVLGTVLAAAGYLARREGKTDTRATLSRVPELLEFVPRIVPVQGRLSPVRCGQPFGVMVDYAHTPGAFAKVLPMMREGLTGRLIVVFGSGGERDREKRPLQGRAAADNAEIVILADEDPRGEDRMSILEAIASGCPERRRGEDLYLIPDRRSAIRKAVALAQPGDLVLLLGKGHEYSIIHADGSIPWDEDREARDALAAIGYSR
jgi:UDP-N-acetylmuramoyl-L-alanyl-D-glutamate--2,6-diaminopimelate ligase